MKNEAGIERVKEKRNYMKNINKEEIHSIFKRIKENDKNAIEELYVKYKDLIINISFSIVKDKFIAEEIGQMIFVKIMQMQKEKLPTNNELTWLYTVTKNQTLDYLKKKHNDINIETIYNIPEQDNNISEIIDKDYYNRLISCLEDKEKEIVSLKIFANLSFRQISQILDMPIATVQWKYYKSVHTLKILLGNLSMFIITLLFYANSNIHQENKKDESKSEVKTPHSITPSSIDGYSVKGETSAIQSSSQSNNTQIGLVSVSSIFLVITIIFTIIFVKHQQKRHHKSSK